MLPAGSPGCRRDALEADTDVGALGMLLLVWQWAWRRGFARDKMLHEKKEHGDRKSTFRWQEGKVFRSRKRTRRCAVGEAKAGENFREAVASPGKCLGEARQNN